MLMVDNPVFDGMPADSEELEPEIIQIKENSMVVLDGPALLFVARLNRPYAKQSAVPPTTPPQIETKPREPPTNTESEPDPQTESLADELSAETSSEDSIVIVKTTSSSDDLDGVKMKWFREEMRQSPVIASMDPLTKTRDGSWTVNLAGEQTPIPDITDSMKASISSSSTDIVVVEHLPSLSPVAAEPSPPISDDNPIMQPTRYDTPPKSPSCDHNENDLHIDATTVIHTVQTVKSKFVIVGGKVQRMQSGHSTNEPTSSAAVDEFLLDDEPDVDPSVAKLPPRKKRKLKKRAQRNKEEEAEQESDGWSTEDLNVTETAREVSKVVKEESQVDAVEVDLLTVTAEETHTEDLASSEVMKSLVEPVGISMVVVAEPAQEMDEPISENEISESPIKLEPEPRSTVPVETKANVSDSDAMTAPDPAPTPPMLKVECRYEIVAGKVRKITGAPCKLNTEGAAPSNDSTPLMSPAHSATSHHSSEHHTFPHRRRGSRDTFNDFLNRSKQPHQDHRRGASTQRAPRMSEPPEAAKRFVDCGQDADLRTIGSLLRNNAPWPGAPHHSHSSPVVVGPTTKSGHEKVSKGKIKEREGDEKAVAEHEEAFDPFRWENSRTVQELKDKYPPLLSTRINLRDVLISAPFCFCGKRCARFDGIVPVYVCGMFNDT